MKYGVLLTVLLLAFAAYPALADNAVSPDTLDSRTAGITPPVRHEEVPSETPPPLPSRDISWNGPAPVEQMVGPRSGILSSDSGEYQYEALAPGAEKLPRLEPLAPLHLESHKPMIAIVIDDMGVDRKHSARAVKLPAAVTLSYLAYSTKIADQTDEAKKAGHELLVHVPMQPDRSTADPGPNYLGTDMTAEQLQDRLEKNLGAFTGYVGINNHMGSKFTCDKAGVDVVMAALSKRKLMFLDSRTSPKSVAEEEARDHHLQTTHRDVFIDNDESAAAVAKSIAQIEVVAKKYGTAIAIGHPKDVTLDALEKWLPTLKDKGFELVPVSEIINLRSPAKSAVASAAKLPKAPEASAPAKSAPAKN